MILKVSCPYPPSLVCCSGMLLNFGATSEDTRGSGGHVLSGLGEPYLMHLRYGWCHGVLCSRPFFCCVHLVVDMLHFLARTASPHHRDPRHRDAMAFFVVDRSFVLLISLWICYISLHGLQVRTIGFTNSQLSIGDPPRSLGISRSGYTNYSCESKVEFQKILTFNNLCFQLLRTIRPNSHNCLTINICFQLLIRIIHCSFSIHTCRSAIVHEVRRPRRAGEKINRFTN